MLKSAVGIIIKKNKEDWQVEIIRNSDKYSCPKRNITVRLYLVNFKCDHHKINKIVNEGDHIRLSYKKIKTSKNCSRIIVYDICKLILSKKNKKDIFCSSKNSTTESNSCSHSSESCTDNSESSDSEDASNESDCSSNDSQDSKKTIFKIIRAGVYILMLFLFVKIFIMFMLL